MTRDIWARMCHDTFARKDKQENAPCITDSTRLQTRRHEPYHPPKIYRRYMVRRVICITCSIHTHYKCVITSQTPYILVHECLVRIH